MASGVEAYMRAAGVATVGEMGAEKATEIEREVAEGEVSVRRSAVGNARGGG